MIQPNQQTSHTRIRNFLTILLWVLLASAVVPTVCLFMLYMAVIIWFRGASLPVSSAAEVFAITAIPSLVVAGAVGFAALSIWLWDLAKWRALSFPIALALDAAALVAAVILMLVLKAGG